MSELVKLPLVTTIRERCRVCYTCVRECPAKAIRVTGGQAQVLHDRCIGCGNCVRVCSQEAKHVLSSVGSVRALLASGGHVAACVAPSFPAEFTDMVPGELVSMIRRLGFDSVHEVAYGADLVAAAYGKLLERHPGRRFIATTCPAIVSYVERFHPDLVPCLAPVVSPMVATARALRRLLGPGVKVVFVGPCLAKKEEAVAEQVHGEVDAVLMFGELRLMFAEDGLLAGGVPSSDFDPPFSGRGALFPLSRGMLQAAGISEDLTRGDVVAADGRAEFQDAIREFENGDLDARLLEVLCCTGCVMGPGMTTGAPLFGRRSRVSEYVRDTLARRDADQVREGIEQLADLDLTRSYARDDQRLVVPSQEELGGILARMGKARPADELNCGACGYETCRMHALAIHEGLAESEMCLPYMIEQLRSTVRQLAVSNDQLASAQDALVQSEKLASMGQLAAGIAHEVNNPLGVVLMYSHLLLDEVSEDSPLKTDLSTIVEQTDRAKRIVAGLLNFARQNQVEFAPSDVRQLMKRCLRSVPAPENVRVEVSHQGDDPLADLDADQVAQVLINLIGNAFAAMPRGGVLSVRTECADGQVRFIVRDTGVGIQPENRKKIFTPFFTTKKAGQGTGLGLAVSYGIVKMHRGDIKVESNADPSAGPTGTTLTVTLPARRAAEERIGDPAPAPAEGEKEGRHVE
jgi:signal transduction histidine kinase/NAD-dependent dihydropyrimidine dehydrogenase PreA subunit